MTFEQAMQENLGYTCKTTFWNDFTIADRFGVDAIKDTYKRAFNEWKDNVEFVTELVLVLNHKIWVHHGRGNNTQTRFPEYHRVRAEIYNALWNELHSWCLDNLQGAELDYYFSVID